MLDAVLVEFRQLLNVIARWWLVLLLGAILAGAAGYYASTLADERYASSSQLLVGPVSADFDIGRAATSNVVTYGELLTTQPVMQAAIDRIGLGESVEDLRERVEVDADQTSRIITLTVTDTDAERAAATAQALAEELQAVVPEAAEAPGGSVSIVSPATVSADPVWPTPLMITILAVIGGIAAALIAVILIEFAVGSRRAPRRAPSAPPAETRVRQNPQYARRAPPARDAPKSSAGS